MPNKNKNRGQYHAYDPKDMERLRSIPLPPKLKCNMCDRNLPQSRFSNKQLTDVRSQIAREGRMTKTPKCLMCSGGRIVELECVACHKTKGLEEFARSQCKVQDTATCYDCTEAQVTRDAVRDSTYEKRENMFIKTDSSKINFTDYFSSASSTHETESTIDEWTDAKAIDGSRRSNQDDGIDLSAQFQRELSERGAVSDTLIDSEYSQTPARRTPTAASSWNTPTMPSASHSSSRVSGTPSVSGSVRTFNSSIAEHSSTGYSGTGRSGFAKIRASDTVVDPNLWGKNTASASSYSSSDDEDGSDNGNGNDDDDDGDDDDEFFDI